ncbi:hypothetical protein PFDG_05520 [Plasmodium falciparum Dd2]|uniref:Uncharacterized protein n=1 Tax=Plasmodium falciparum (isolate Dd2) TaxID=57267 RepID=A0A0L7M2T5_PLAF4|nr:hypothetical protein PFDG_05520 [Plasmodium falciparum Dd2]
MKTQFGEGYMEYEEGAKNNMDYNCIRVNERNGEIDDTY